MSLHRLRKRKFSVASAASALAFLLYIVLPAPDATGGRPFSTIVTDAGGNLLAATIAADEQWRFPPPEALPEKYIAALIAYEDKRFFTHFGIDPLAMLRAMRSNWQQDRIVSGASTITMQLARLIRGDHARSYRAKAAEALLAIKLEFHFSKQEILGFYAALAPMGGNTVGINAANWRYFQHRLEDISWAEAALLAVLPNNPAGIHPGNQREALLIKRNRLLERLAERGHLSSLDLKLARLESLPAAPLPLPSYTPHLLQTLKSRFPGQTQFKTAIDSGLQRHLLTMADSYGRQNEKNNIHNLSILVLDNRNNNVIAYLGNQTPSQNPEYAPAVDIVQRPRSSGSLFKPFLFALMLQQGHLLPGTLIPDIPTHYDGYSPENYDHQYRGLVPARQALSQSLNVPAVRLLDRYGVAAFKDNLQQLGLSTLWRPAEDYGLSLILGGAETTLWEITNAFARLVKSAQGDVVSPVIARLHHRHLPASTRYPVATGAAWLTLEALVDVNRPGVAANWREFSSSQKIAWKSGTSYGWHDAWAVGSNGRFTVGVWAGNANGEEARQLSGTATAAPVMLDVFNHLSFGGWPARPEYALKQYKVCKADGYLSGSGCETVSADAPVEADFTDVTPYHELMHVDRNTRLRVHGLCESPRNMQAISRFVVPPVHAYYYTQLSSNLQAPPAWRRDCLDNLPGVAGRIPFALEYPTHEAKVKIPVELDGKLGRVVVKARHRESNAVIYWHLDDAFLAATRHIHEQAIAVNPGWHQLTLVDEKGYRVTRWFKAI
jgi:penicillin-binding protein 1C